MNEEHEVKEVDMGIEEEIKFDVFVSDRPTQDTKRQKLIGPKKRLRPSWALLESKFVQCNACTGGFCIAPLTYYAGWRCFECISANNPDKGLDLSANEFHLKK